MRIDLGVTSTSSSSLMNSSENSSVSIGGTNDVLVAARGADVGELLGLQRIDGLGRCRARGCR